MEDYLLALFIPGRRQLGTLAGALAKYGVQSVPGSEEPSIIARYADQKGLLITLAGWSPAAVDESKRSARVTLPESLVSFLINAHGSAREGIEVTLVTPARGLRYHAKIKLDRIGEPLAIGCRYQVAP